jgi:hypothetical protein
VQVRVQVALRGEEGDDALATQVGQWCDAKAASVRVPNVSMASVRYVDHTCGSRTSAPRSVNRLCRVWVAFSAMHNVAPEGFTKHAIEENALRPSAARTVGR